MANEMRYRKSGDFITVAVDSATVIEVGDMVYLETDDARPASSKVWDTNLATTQANFKAVFLGIAMQQSRSGDTDPIRIRTRGVFEMDSPAATYEVGALVGPDQSGGSSLLDQTVEAAVLASSVGRVVKKYAANTTRVLVYFQAYLFDMD